MNKIDKKINKQKIKINKINTFIKVKKKKQITMIAIADT